MVGGRGGEVVTLKHKSLLDWLREDFAIHAWEQIPY